MEASLVYELDANQKRIKTITEPPALEDAVSQDYSDNNQLDSSDYITKT